MTKNLFCCWQEIYIIIKKLSYTYICVWNLKYYVLKLSTLKYVFHQRVMMKDKFYTIFELILSYQLQQQVQKFLGRIYKDTKNIWLQKYATLPVFSVVPCCIYNPYFQIRPNSGCMTVGELAAGVDTWLPDGWCPGYWIWYLVACWLMAWF